MEQDEATEEDTQEKEGSQTEVIVLFVCLKLTECEVMCCCCLIYLLHVQ